jgi:hypothetical protein
MEIFMIVIIIMNISDVYPIDTKIHW